VDGGRWLDVGCSFGWLLRHVSRGPFRGFGVEPSISALPGLRGAGLAVCAGRYPDVLGPRARFEVVSFMDVLEHFERPAEVLAATRSLLARDGVLAIQVPDRACYLYLAASLLGRLPGRLGSFALQRLWLEGFDFPHQVYFTPEGLDLLLRRTGFAALEWHRPSIGRPAQAFDRVGYTGGGAPLRLAAGAAVAALAVADGAAGHGGLITVLARPTDSPTAASGAERP
jgi:SAM-dependent methyltransferase